MTKLTGEKLLELLNKRHNNTHISDIGVLAGYNNGEGEATLEFYNELVKARRLLTNRL